MPHIPINELDEGIWDVANWLVDNGFHVAGGSDGRDNGNPLKATEPSIYMIFDGPMADDPAHWSAEADRLLDLMARRGVEVNPGDITASWDPVTRRAVLLLLDFDDVALACHPA